MAATPSFSKFFFYSHAIVCIQALTMLRAGSTVHGHAYPVSCALPEQVIQYESVLETEILLGAGLVGCTVSHG